MTTAFQSNAFQTNAFQIDAVATTGSTSWAREGQRSRRYVQTRAFKLSTDYRAKLRFKVDAQILKLRDLPRPPVTVALRAVFADSYLATMRATVKWAPEDRAIMALFDDLLGNQSVYESRFTARLRIAVSDEDHVVMSLLADYVNDAD